MATVFLRIDHIDKSVTQSDKFLINCSSKQEILLRRANRKSTHKDKYALFALMLCSLLPQGDTLNLRKQELLNHVKSLKDAAQLEENNLSLSLLLNQQSIINTFFSGPYGIFKVLRSPLSILDPAADFRISQIIITNTLDQLLFSSILI